MGRAPIDLRKRRVGNVAPGNSVMLLLCFPLSLPAKNHLVAACITFEYPDKYLPVSAATPRRPHLVAGTGLAPEYLLAA
ncbi:MAG TPA: hypothetical protein DCW29_03765, partial [Janthinobacterium sp.]|nr:hypothetical protein [Janthinobacterium sp.]